MTRKSLPLIRRRVYRTGASDFYGGINATADERLLPFDRGATAYNLDFSTGALREGWGIGMPLLTDAQKIWLYRRHDFATGTDERIRMYCNGQGQVFYNRGDGFRRLEGIRFSAPPYAVNYRLYGDDVVILCSPKDDMYVWDGVNAAYAVSGSPRVTSLTMHYERMFVTTADRKNAVWFSDDLDPTNWNPELSEGGFIEWADERGQANRVLSFNNYVYVFRDYGISRLTAQGDQSGFSAVNLFVSGGRMYPDTAAVCGNRIIFLASDGLYSFDGTETRRLSNTVGELFGGGNPTACFFDGRYFAALHLCADRETTQSVNSDLTGETATPNANNGLIVYDPTTGQFSFTYGIDVCCLCPLADGLREQLYAVCSDGRVGEVSRCGSAFGIALKKLWRSGFTDLGAGGRLKSIRGLSVDTRTDVTVTVFTERASKSFTVRGGIGVKNLRVNMKGYKAGIRIEADTAKVSFARPVLTFALVE